MTGNQHLISKDNQPKNAHKTQFSKDNQPSRESVSNGAKKRWATQRMMNRILEATANKELLKELKKKRNIDLPDSATVQEVMMASCSHKAAKKGDAKALIDLLKIGGKYEEKQIIQDERKIIDETVEYKEL